jgi:hydrogenase/urease accessory protein HupE
VNATTLRVALIGTLLSLVGGWQRATAHPLDPVFLQIIEAPDGTLDVTWRLPLAQPAAAPLEPVLPDGCTRPSEPSVTESERRATLRWQMDCAGRSLTGLRVGVEGLHERGTDALLRVQLASGRTVQKVLRGDDAFFTIPGAPRAIDVIRDYLVLGVEHILTGFDHLLFVLGLVLLVDGARQGLWTITAFTAGHSVTLSLAVLGFVSVPPLPVEALIALSVFILGVELTRDAPGNPSWIRRAPWRMAFAFGLLHGLGFAGALTQVGLPAEEIPLALFSFNVGIELGQLLFIVAIGAGLATLPASWSKAVRLIPAYAIGSLAAFWVIDRVVLLLL